MLHFSKFESLSKTHQWSKIPNALKLAVCNTDIGIYDSYISIFFYIGDPRSCLFHDPPIRYKSMVKNEVPLMRIRSAQITQNHNQIGYACYPRRAVASFPVERSSEVTLWRHRVAVPFLPITFDRNELETWGWCHSVRLVKSHRLTCNMTYLGHTVTLTWRDLGSNFKLNLSRIKKHMDRSGLTRGTRRCQNDSPNLSRWLRARPKAERVFAEYDNFLKLSDPTDRPTDRDAFQRLIPGVSEKSDEFITCVFRVVLGIERRMGYQVKACSKIFCLSENPPLGVTVLGYARAFSWCPLLPVPAKTSIATRLTSTWIAKLTVKTSDFGHLGSQMW